MSPQNIAGPEVKVSNLYVPAPNVIQNPAERAEKTTMASTHDRDSWKAHSDAQLALGTEAYIPNYIKFIGNRQVVESIQFGISNDSSRVVATWLGRSAMYHDEAESAQDSGNTEGAAAGWENVKRALVTRYLCLSYARTLQLEEQEFLQLFNDVDLMSINPSEMTALLKERVGTRFGNNFEERLSNAKIQAKFELLQWQTHHMRDYDGFDQATVSLLVSLGYTPQVAESAAPYLAAGCKNHDEAEAIPANSEKVEALWEGAEKELVRYYDTLLTQNN